MSFSEFSYGFALTNELVGWAPLAIAPVFPSLLAEGGPGGGWDVMLEMPAMPLYLQFKRSQRIRRASGKEARIAAQQGLALTAPYHRFPITDALTSNQHRMLLELDNGDQQVFYVAPGFSTIDDLNTHWRDQEVADNSVFVRPQDIGTLTNGPHNIAFNAAGAWCFSKPQPVTAVPAEDLREKLRFYLEHDPRPLRQTVFEFATHLREAERRGRAATRQRRRPDETEAFGRGRVTGQSSSDIAGVDEVRQVLNEMAQTALGVFDAQLILVQPAS
jgi:hypothetical protein